AQEVFDRAVARKRIRRQDAERGMRLIAPTLDYSGFGATDLVVEAVVERLDVKEAVLREAESYLGPDAILASNTSTLSITEMQHALEVPERFCGMHFFNPV